MSDRIYNLNPGPAVLPEEVLRETQDALWNAEGSGMGILEHSHRGKLFERVIGEAEEDCRRLAGAGDDWAVLFLQGGASTQFFMLPANFLPEGGTADYLVTGSWSKKAVKEAAFYGRAHTAASSEDTSFDRIPRAEATRHSERPAYVHFTSNNTIYGTQWRGTPEVPEGAFLACDASSDVFSRPLDVERYGLVYAGAQKNLGPSGVTLVLLRRSLLERTVRELPTMQRYATFVESGSLFNTPPVFAIYVMGRVFKWLLAQGGLEAMAERNARKAALLYEAIDASDFWEGTAERESRSHMNVTFRSPRPELDQQFLKEAEAEGLSGLKGHRSVGGMRASLYNAFPERGCKALARFMKDFAAKRG